MQEGLECSQSSIHLKCDQWVWDQVYVPLQFFHTYLGKPSLYRSLFIDCHARAPCEKKKKKLSVDLPGLELHSEHSDYVYLETGYAAA